MKIKVNGTEIFYEKTGSGAPVLLLHGNGEDHTIFDPLVRKMSKEYTLYCPDSRNHGRSEKTAQYSYQVMAEDMENMLLKLNTGPVYLLGFSDGAIIGLLLAMRAPALLRKMMLLGVNCMPEDLKPQVREALQEQYQKTGAPLLRLMLEEPHIEMEDVARIHLPTYIIGGEQDVVEPACFARLHENIPDSRLAILEGEGHDTYIVGKDTLWPLIHDFFH